MVLLPGLFCSKVSLLLLLLQIFDVNGRVRFAVWVGIAATFVTYFPGIPIEAYYQTPSQGQSWEDLMVSGKPNHAIYWGLVQSALGIILDFYMFILPLPTVLRLHMPFRRRVHLALVFSTAFLYVPTIDIRLDTRPCVMLVSSSS